MVSFPSPSAAVECGMRMQQLMELRNRSTDEQLHLRIGLSTGEATAEEGDYFGMPSIEAARLCDKASSDGILAAPSVKMLAAGREGLSFEAVGALELKGIPEPMEAFAVTWEPLATEEVVRGSVLPVVLRSTPEIAYVGRADENRWLRELSSEARDGRRRVVFLSGEPGVGKTRLASRTALENHNAGFTVCWGAAAEDVGAPYGPWIQALSHYVEHAPEEVLTAHLERHGGQITRLLRDPLAERIAGVPVPQAADPETERYLLCDAVAGLLQEASNRHPLMLVLDDLHWADRETLSLVKHVAATTTDSALLLLGTYRESDLDRKHPLADVLADLHRLDGAEQRTLQGLAVDEVAAMVSTVGGLEIDNGVGLELARQVAQETDGNPFFVTE